MRDGLTALSRRTLSHGAIPQHLQLCLFLNAFKKGVSSYDTRHTMTLIKRPRLPQADPPSLRSSVALSLSFATASKMQTPLAMFAIQAMVEPLGICEIVKFIQRFLKAKKKDIGAVFVGSKSCCASVGGDMVFLLFSCFLQTFSTSASGEFFLLFGCPLHCPPPPHPSAAYGPEQIGVKKRHISLSDHALVKSSKPTDPKEGL